MATPLRILALLSDPLLDPTGRPVTRLDFEREMEWVEKQLARQVDATTNGAFGLAAWVGEMGDKEQNF
jgi:hypothetical protein